VVEDRAVVKKYAEAGRKVPGTEEREKSSVISRQSSALERDKREGGKVGRSIMGTTWVHPGNLPKECGSDWNDWGCILLFAKRVKE